jgi:uncharacterized membrane protein YfcA
MSTNLYAPPKAHVADIVQGEAAPPLWNPGVAASWSLLFSPAFGAFLHMKNWEALGESDKAAAAKKWVVVIIATILGLSVAGAILPHNKDLAVVLRLSNLGLLLTWYYASGKPQTNFVKSRYGKQYPRKEWAQPLLIAIAAIIGFIVVVGVLVVVAAVLFRRA